MKKILWPFRCFLSVSFANFHGFNFVHSFDQIVCISFNLHKWNFHFISFHGFDISFPFHQKQSCGIIIIIIELLTEGSYTGNTQSLSHWPFEQFNSFFYCHFYCMATGTCNAALCLMCVFTMMTFFLFLVHVPKTDRKNYFRAIKWPFLRWF